MPDHAQFCLSSSHTTASVFHVSNQAFEKPVTKCTKDQIQTPLPMALHRRPLPGESDKCPQQPTAKRPKTKRKLLARHDMPLWCSNNKSLLTGYRPISESVQQCVESLKYIHNETVNIYSHLVPAVITLARTTSIHLYFRAHYPNALWTDQLTFYLHLGLSTFCFTVSTIYHISLSHSKFYAEFWGRLDYVAILLRLVGSGMSGTYFGFYCKPILQLCYLILVGLAPHIN